MFEQLLKNLRKKRIALVYDRINKWGGAERVLLALHEIFPDAPLFTSVYHEEKAKWAKGFKIKSSVLQKVPGASSSHELYPFLMPIAFESFSFNEYDVVISVTSEAAKGILTSPKTVHICYCLTPTRYLWSGYEEYFPHPVQRMLYFPFIYYLRGWDKIAAERPDAFIAISKEVQKRIKDYYGKESSVVYPPVTLATSRQQLATKARGYYLVVSRLVTYKKIHLAVEACNALKLPLVVIGTGSEERKLQSIAGETITFIPTLTDDELVSYYKGCRALLFPGSEDFGLTILEAQSLGKPVIAYKGGGALETVVSGKTGKFFFPQTSNALIAALKTFKQETYKARDCKMQAKRFTKENFTKQLLEELSKYL